MQMFYIIDFLMILLHCQLFFKRKILVDVSSSVLSLLKPYDFLFFVDIILLIGIALF